MYPSSGERRYTPRGNLQFYLHDHRENIKKLDGKPTSALTAEVHELRGITTTKENSSRIIHFPVGKSSDRMEGLNVISDPLEEISSSCLQELSNDHHDQNYRGPASSHLEERENQIYWTVCIQWPGISDLQGYKALVCTGTDCTLMPSRSVGAESLSISGATEGSQQLMVLEPDVSLLGNEWQNHPILIGPETPCTLGIDNSGESISRAQKGIVGLLG
ncbi:hypothetical protein HGM15179_009193 [Zosterops borbonicus]|uniref:Uncharacterized protein n=1 Tax=Zosterops borbonicus TaxID=364589 RepID=A0A8K1GGS0_9PASS|nr:hypothetical protein HGM15179_009193 [Zosterops borbonicus]